MMAVENQFPGYREPQKSDNLRASAPLDPDFLVTFKRSLKRSGRSSHFTNQDPTDENGTQQGLSVHEPVTMQPGTEVRNAQNPPGGQELVYPVAMFLELPDLPSPEILDKLIDLFSVRVRIQTPFLRDMQLFSKALFQKEKRPPFVLFATATVGAMAADDGELNDWGSSLWLIASRVHSACCEVDNRMARREDWVASFYLLAMYGIMHADTALWSKTNTWNGHVDTAAKRIGIKLRLSRSSNEQDNIGDSESLPTRAPSLLESARMMGFFFMIDLMRSLQLNVNATFRPFDLSLLLSDGSSFQEVYSNLVFSSRPLPSNLNPDEYLLLLLSLLSEILNLQRWLGPLTTGPMTEKLDANSTRLVPEYLKTSSASATLISAGSSSFYQNPYLVLSPDAEYLRISNVLSDALVKWESTCLAYRNGQHSAKIIGDTRKRVEVSTIPLFHLCRLFLSGGPRLYTMTSIAGYSPEGQFKASQHVEPDSVPLINEAALGHAWRILEAVDHTQSEINGPADDPSSTRSPIWYPIAVFYAGLTLWASMYSSRDLPNQHGPGPRRKKMLRLFEIELREMKWPCASIMANVLRDLKSP